MRTLADIVAPVVAGLAVLIAPRAMAQFQSPGSPSDIVERYTGTLESAEGEPAPEAGDQVGVFFGDQIIGLFTFSSTSQQDLGPRGYDMLVFGDDPETEGIEGPEFGDTVRFRFFDSSTNTVRTDVAARNEQGETVNVSFQGQETFEIPIDVPGAPPFPDAPAREFLLVLGAQPADGDDENGDDDGNGDGEAPAGNPDVNGDGEIDKRDAALVLRLVVGGRVASEDMVGRADVDGDGAVTTRDAIEVLRAGR